MQPIQNNKTAPKYPLQIQHQTQKQCYICGRDASQIASILRPAMKKVFKAQAQEQNAKKVQEQNAKKVQQLKFFYKLTESYQKTLTLGELQAHHELALKIAPEYKRLATFTENAQPTDSILVLRNNLLKLIQKIENGDYSTLPQINPKITRTMQVTENKEFSIGEMEFSSIPQDFFFDQAGNQLYEVTLSDYEETYVRYYSQTEIGALERICEYLSTIRSNDVSSRDFREIMEIKSIKPEKVVKITLVLYLCPICSHFQGKITNKKYHIRDGCY